MVSDAMSEIEGARPSGEARRYGILVVDDETIVDFFDERVRAATLRHADAAGWARRPTLRVEAA